MRRRRRCAVALAAGLLALAIPPPSATEEPAAARTLVMATKEAPPFAMRDAAGDWSGISLSLWQRVAAETGVRYRLVEAPLEELVPGVADGRFDAAVAALTMSPGREELIDFSHPYYSSGLGMAVRAGGGGWLPALRRLASPRFLGVVALLLLVLLAVGCVVWVFERRRNAGQFGGSTAEGLGAGMWWSAVTMTTVGYGDKAPVTLGGRVVALLWMFTSLILISAFTAAITSSLTLSGLEGTVQGPEDLPGVRVAAIAGSTGQQWLAARGLEHRPLPDAGAALAALAAGEVAAVVHDASILGYLTRDRSDLEVLPHRLDEQLYGFALPHGSPLREPINRALLTELERPEWRRVVASYLE